VQTNQSNELVVVTAAPPLVRDQLLGVAVITCPAANVPETEAPPSENSGGGGVYR
jgi:hypothetical protein